jgi:hypothetical protein
VRHRLKYRVANASKLIACLPGRENGIINNGSPCEQRLRRRTTMVRWRTSHARSAQATHLSNAAMTFNGFSE